MRMKKVLTLILTGTLLVVFSSVSVAAKFYRWKDADGITHYTVNPPPEGIQGEEVRTFNTTSSDQPDALRRLEQQREAASERREEARKEELAEEKPRDAAKDRCATHRKNLKTLQEESVVSRQDPESGEQTILTKEQREQMLEDTRKALEICEQQNFEENP